MTHPGQDNQPPQRPADPTRAVQLPSVPPPPPGAPQHTPPPPPPAGGPQQASPPPPPGAPQPQSGWAPPPPPPGQHAPGQPVPGQPGPQGGWTPPGQPPQGQPYQQWAPGQGGPAPMPPKKSGGAGKILGIVGGVLALVVVAVLIGVFVSAGEPEVGDCIEPTGTSFEVVDCDDDAAQYEVIGVQDGEQTYEEFFADPNTCSEFPEALYYAWYGPEGEEGKVYCAAPV
ncbi:hypothetical protein ACI8AF_05775 [Blastococcus sp. SYSU D00669]